MHFGWLCKLKLLYTKLISLKIDQFSKYIILNPQNLMPIQYKVLHDEKKRLNYIQETKIQATNSLKKT